MDGNFDGWIPSNDEWTYVSANSFKITGVDKTSIYTKGTRVKFTNNSTTIYGVLIDSEYSTDTTVTLAPNDDYSVNNSAIQNPYYSYQVNPQGYPTWFNYTPTLTWTGTAPTGDPVGLSIFKIDGSSCTLNISYYNYTAGSNVTALEVTIPVDAVGVNAAAGNIRNLDTPNLTIGYVYPGSDGGLYLFCSSVAATGFVGMATYQF